MRGLGDLIEKVTVNTGIKRIVDKIAKVTGKDCGCGKRKAMLNRMVPFSTEDETTETSNDSVDQEE